MRIFLGDKAVSGIFPRAFFAHLAHHTGHDYLRVRDGTLYAGRIEPIAPARVDCFAKEKGIPVSESSRDKNESLCRHFGMGRAKYIYGIYKPTVLDREQARESYNFLSHLAVMCGASACFVYNGTFYGEYDRFSMGAAQLSNALQDTVLRKMIPQLTALIQFGHLDNYDYLRPHYAEHEPLPRALQDNSSIELQQLSKKELTSGLCARSFF